LIEDLIGVLSHLFKDDIATTKIRMTLLQITMNSVL